MKNKKINEKIYFKFLFRSLFFSSIIIFNFFFFFTQFFKLFDPKFKEPPFSHLLIYFTHRRFYRLCMMHGVLHNDQNWSRPRKR